MIKKKTSNFLALIILLITFIPGVFAVSHANDLNSQEEDFIRSLSSQSSQEQIKSNNHITENLLGQSEVPTTSSIIRKIERKGAEVIMIIQAFGKNIVIAALLVSLITMAIGALGNPSLTGKATTSAILCVIMYIAIEYGPMIGDVALNFVKN